MPMRTFAHFFCDVQTRLHHDSDNSGHFGNRNVIILVPKFYSGNIKAFFKTHE